MEQPSLANMLLRLWHEPRALVRDLRRTRETSALYRLLMQRNRTAPQVGMLVVGTGFMLAAVNALLMLARTPEHLLYWLLVRVGVGEFFWSWMAADHCFTLMGRARRDGQLRDWKLAAMNGGDIASAVAHSTAVFLCAAIAIAIFADGFAVFMTIASAEMALSTPAVLAWVALVPLAIAVNHAATAWMATTRCVRDAADPHASIGRWAECLTTLCSQMLVIMGATAACASLSFAIPATVARWLAPDAPRLLGAALFAANPAWGIPACVLVPAWGKLAMAWRSLQAAAARIDEEGSDSPAREATIDPKR